MRRFLKYELDRYLPAAAASCSRSCRCTRVENQQYIHYRKGSLVFYRLREEIGEDALNRALQQVPARQGLQQPPYTTSLELLDYIRAEAPPEQQKLITDLFEKISFYDNRVEAATAKKRADGKYDVTLELHAAKRYADGKGKETAGSSTTGSRSACSRAGRRARKPTRRCCTCSATTSPAQNPVIKVVVDAAPYEAGFDPYNKLIDRVSDDNRKRVIALTRTGPSPTRAEKRGRS